LGIVVLALTAEGQSCQWTATAQFFDFATTEEEMIILGHTGFLEYFTATFDGKFGALTLVPNDELPAIE